LAYLQGLFTEERRLLNLAQHYLYTGLAHKAGEPLERAIRDGAVTAAPEKWLQHPVTTRLYAGNHSVEHLSP
jgi:hypothetical protein